MSTSDPTSESEPVGNESASADEVAATDALTRIERLLHEWFDTSHKTFREIEQIAQQEVQRRADEPPKGHGWYGAGATALFSRTGAAAHNIHLKFASLRDMRDYSGFAGVPHPKP